MSNKKRQLKRVISVFMAAFILMMLPLQTMCYAYIPHTVEEEIAFLSDAIEEIFENDDLYIKEKIHQCDVILYAMMDKAIKKYSFSESLNVLFSLYRTYVKCLLNSLSNFRTFSIDRIYISTDIVIVSFYLFGFFIPSKYISFWIKK